MKLIRFRITNYKNIVDSGWVRVDDLTCLVGKNEAGKSALLYALNKMNPGGGESAEFVPLDEYPRWKYDDYEKAGSPEEEVVRAEWSLDSDEISAVESRWGKGCLKSPTFATSRKYRNTNTYYDYTYDESVMAGHFLTTLPADIRQTLSGDLTSLAKVRAALVGLAEKGQEQVKTFDQVCPKQTAPSALFQIPELSLPKFIYFSTYDVLTGEVALNDYASRPEDREFKVFKALMGLVGTTTDDLKKMTQFEQLQSKLEAVSNSISKRIKTYWQQNQYLRVQFHFNEGKPGDRAPFNNGIIFRTRIHDTRHEFTGPFSFRSTGFVWFFSFLVWFSRLQNTYGKKLVVLLDEPGLTLHGHAQEDLLTFIKKEVLSNCEVIYSTHSPFMVDGSNLSSVRAVEDKTTEEEKIGTKVSEDILLVSKDTLFPLQTALGYGIAQSLFVGANTLLLEGASDILYFEHFRHALTQLKRPSLHTAWVLCPCGGIGNVLPFVTLFGGKKLNIATVTDYQIKEKKKIEQIKQHDVLKAGRVLLASDYAGQSEADVEDILGRELSVALVNEAFELPSAKRMPDTRPAGTSERFVEEAKAHFAILTPGDPEYDHYKASYRLAIMDLALAQKLPGYAVALDRFQRLFEDINKFVKV